MGRMVMAAVMSLALAATALGQEPEVDRAEVLRLGDMVQHVDGVRSDPQDVFVEAMGPPASDADKWYISVLSMQGCAACQKLKTDWATNQWLSALADPSDPKKSWAHYNVYLREDRSQAFRFENIKVTAYPTVLVQPPRSGRYGDPKTVVFQGTYGGDPERLARQITAAIRQYVSKFEASQPSHTPAHRAPEGSIGIDPPWQPPPKIDPTLPSVTPVFPDGRPLIPPNLNPPSLDPPDSTTPTAGPWGTLLIVAGTSLVTLLLALGVPWAIQAFRQWRIESGKRTLLPDEQFQKLVDALSAAASGPGAKTVPSDAPGAPSGT
jgi:hypothetical protein